MAQAGRKPLPEGEKWEDRFKKKNVAVLNEHAKFLKTMKKNGLSYTDYFGGRIETDPRFQHWKGNVGQIGNDQDMLTTFIEFTESFTSWAEKLDERLKSLEEKVEKLL